jgi:hypothetical protein
MSIILSVTFCCFYQNAQAYWTDRDKERKRQREREHAREKDKKVGVPGRRIKKWQKVN